MSELIFMPTPNWFISRPVEICEQGNSIATCAINSIIVTNNLVDNFSFCIKDAHTKRLHGLSFYSSESKNLRLLASCSEDLDIKVWDFATKNLFNQHKLHQNSPSCIDWLKFDESSNIDPTLISCDIKGNIFKWNMNSNEHTRYFAENKPITQVKALFNNFIIALGYKNGTIVVLDVKNEQMKILHKLKNHEDSINCLVWYPKLNSNTEIECKLKEEFKVDELDKVLCSSSEDKTIRFWCIDKGAQIKCLKAPGSTGVSSSSKSAPNKNQQTQAAKINYTPLCWPNPYLIVSGSFKGELFYNNLENIQPISSSDYLPKWQQFTNLPENQGHKKIIFDISCSRDSLITLSLDRLINTWSLTSFKQQSSMTTLNGFVYSVVASPIDSNYLGVSVGDSSIKFINEKQNLKHARTFNNNIKSEVTQIAWHPSRDSIIAFGTKDGKVGIADVMSNNKPAHYIFTNYNQSVYTLIWCDKLIPGELSEHTTSKKLSSLNLYSVADGKIMHHCIPSISFGKEPSNSTNILSTNFYNDLKKYFNDINPINHIGNSKETIEYGLTEFSVLKIDLEEGMDKNDYFFAIGKFDGSIEVYRALVCAKQVEKICTFFNHQKLVTCISWNRKSYSKTIDEPIYMASGSNDFNVIIIDFKNLILDFEKNKKSVDYFSKYKHKLVGHKERITGLSWSFNSGINLLASCSYDSTVQIWDTDNGTPISNYRGHSEKLLCCMFSNNDPNVVFSGGEGYCLHKWRIDAQEHKTPPEECLILLGKKKNKLIKKLQNKKDETEAHKVVEQNISLTLEVKKETILLENDNKEIIIQDIKDETIESLTVSEPVKQLKAKITKSSLPKNELKSLFVLSSYGSKSQKSKIIDCLTLYEKLYEKNLSFELDLCKFDFEKEQLNLCLFGNRTSVLEMLKQEQTELRRINFDKWWIFEIWKGNISKIMNEFRETNSLNDIIFTLYQIATGYNENSIDLLNIYIDQLSKEVTTNPESIHKAVLYSLASYQIEKAIELYLLNNYFQYALCIAQLRLPPKSGLLNKILNKYASYSTHVGDYETAILCYIRLGDFQNAFKTLLRRNSKNDLEFENLIKSLQEKFSNSMKKNEELINEIN